MTVRLRLSVDLLLTIFFFKYYWVAVFPYFLIEAVFFAVWRLLKIIYFTWYFILSFLNRYVHFCSYNWSIFKNSDSFFIKIWWHQASFIRARSTTASKSSSVFFFSFATIALSTNSSSFYEHYVWEKLSFAMKFDLLISSPSKPAYQWFENWYISVLQ